MNRSRVKCSRTCMRFFVISGNCTKASLRDLAAPTFLRSVPLFAIILCIIRELLWRKHARDRATVHTAHVELFGRKRAFTPTASRAEKAGSADQRKTEETTFAPARARQMLDRGNHRPSGGSRNRDRMAFAPDSQQQWRAHAGL